MDPLALLRKEALLVRRNLGLFAVLLIVVPAALAGGTAVYQQTIPQDIPVAVVPADEDTTDEDMRPVRATVRFFSTPVRYEDRESAVQALEREEVYLVFVVPSGLSDENASVTLEVISDRTYAPMQDPTEVVMEMFANPFDQATLADVEIEHTSVGTEQTLSSFMLPSALFALVVLYSMVYIPYQVREERRVIDRLRTETSLELVVASKLLFYGALVAIPALTVTAASWYYGYGFDALGPGTLLVLFLTFLYMAAAGLAVLFAMRLRQMAVFVDLGLAVGVLTLSGLIYPVGFYSAVRKVISRSLPSHYSLVTLRGTMLRDMPLTAYPDYLAWIVGACVVTILALAAAIRLYERGGIHE